MKRRRRSVQNLRGGEGVSARLAPVPGIPASSFLTFGTLYFEQITHVDYAASSFTRFWPSRSVNGIPPGGVRPILKRKS